MTGATKLSEMGGLGRRYPLIAAAFTVGVLAISGIPPFNGYVSLGLIHDSLRTSGQWAPYVFVLVAQVITIAALGKAAWVAFYRPRQSKEDFERDDQLHPGMTIALGTLSAACVAFGVRPNFVLAHIASPAASALLHPVAYARGVLASGGTIPHLLVTFDYVSPLGLTTVVGTVLLAVPVGRAALRFEHSTPVELLRRIQSGSVNDYAAYAVAGILVVALVLSRGVLA
jgi:multicomponent Na+:H+ antiporter subunit D